MKTILMLIVAMLFSSALIISPASAKGVYPQDTSNAKKLREDLPAYVFEYDLERLYPSTWEFYKKLDIVNRDRVYSHYLYNPQISDVRHKIFELALGKGKGKTHPKPTSVDQVIANNSNAESAVGSSSLSIGVHGITNGPTVTAVNFNANSHQSIYSFLQNN